MNLEYLNKRHLEYCGQVHHLTSDFFRKLIQRTIIHTRNYKFVSRALPVD